jgi:hypothetical protein
LFAEAFNRLLQQNLPKAEVRALITITSSARPSKDSGMVMPSALAVEVNEQFDLCGLLHG